MTRSAINPAVNFEADFVLGARMARFDGGWVRTWRSIDTSEIGHDGYAKAIFEQLIRWANIKESRVRGITINRGELVSGLDELVVALSFARATIHRKLVLMEKLGMVRRLMRQTVSVITIVNYDKFNPVEASHETVGEIAERRERDESETGERRERDHSKELNNIITKELKNLPAENFEKSQGTELRFQIARERGLEKRAAFLADSIVGAIRAHPEDEVSAKNKLTPFAWSLVENKWGSWDHLVTDAAKNFQKNGGSFFEHQLRQSVLAALLIATDRQTPA